MEKDNGKIVTMFFMGFGILAIVTVRIIFSFLAGQWGAFARQYSQDWLQHFLPAAVGIVLFFVLQFNKTSSRWADEVVTEIRKVVWPSQRDTTAMTIVCCIMVLVAGVIFGLFDFVSSSLVGMALK